MKVLFLDIDGVLNAHDPHPNGYCGLHPDKVARLDRIVAATGCRIVLASAWRYMVLERAMTLNGLGHVLATYGATKATCEALFGTLDRDRNVNDVCDRGHLAARWLSQQRSLMARYCEWPYTLDAVALDDGTSGHPVHPDGTDLGYEAVGIPVVRPDGRVGLTEAEADRVIEFLNKGA